MPKTYQLVRMQPFRLNQKTWTKGKVVRKIDVGYHEIETSQGTVRGNRKHLKKKGKMPQARVIEIVKMIHTKTIMLS